MSQFVSTLKSSESCWKDLIPENVNNSDFLSVLLTQPLRDIRKPKLKIPKYHLLFKKGYQPQFMQETLNFVAFSSRKPPTYTKDKQVVIISVEFYQKDLIKVN